MNPESHEEKQRGRNLPAEWVASLLSLGLGEGLARFGAALLTLILMSVTIWALSAFSEQTPLNLGALPAFASGPTAAPSIDLNLLPLPTDSLAPGVSRFTEPHTNVPTRPRQDIVVYTVVEGDSVFGIAEKYNLFPQTILWANYNVLADDPHSLQPGQKLNILPVNGVYYEWLGDVNFEEWAAFFGVTAADIIEYPGNKLDTDAVGDYAAPNIAKGTWLIIPGGKREYAAWNSPVGVSRDDPAVARNWGPGACGSVSGGNVGTGTYVWPAAHHWLSGNDYSPETNHYGLDIDGETGDPVYATDSGVVVYAGWNDYGYGYMIMIDHGDNWQSLYSHLESIWVTCGESVVQQQTIGGVGSTGKSSGSHLHFEIMHGIGKVNPWNFLPPP